MGGHELSGAAWQGAGRTSGARRRWAYPTLHGGVLTALGMAMAGDAKGANALLKDLVNTPWRRHLIGISKANVDQLSNVQDLMTQIGAVGKELDTVVTNLEIENPCPSWRIPR